MWRPELVSHSPFLAGRWWPGTFSLEDSLDTIGSPQAPSRQQLSTEVVADH